MFHKVMEFFTQIILHIEIQQFLAILKNLCQKDGKVLIKMIQGYIDFTLLKEKEKTGKKFIFAESFD